MTPEHRKAKARQYDKAYRLRHPDKVKARNAAWRAKHLHNRKVREPGWAPTHAWRTYRLSNEGYTMLLQAQGGCCAICHLKKKLVIDHCHTSGKVRGLLCDFCNKGIGFLRDSPVTLHSAIVYLNK